MSTEKMMKEFIEAFVEQYGFGRMGASSNPDAAAMLACAEWAWFKSRAAIEVELPALRSITMGRRENEHDSGFNAGVELCIDAIESLGLKVKP